MKKTAMWVMVLVALVGLAMAPAQAASARPGCYCNLSTDCEAYFGPAPAGQMWVCIWTGECPDYAHPNLCEQDPVTGSFYCHGECETQIITQQ